MSKTKVERIKSKKCDKKTGKKKTDDSDIKNDLDVMFKSKASKSIKKKDKPPIQQVVQPTKVQKEKKQKPRKYVDGLPVYTEEELNIGKGGNTADCPFDCECCF